MTFWQWFQRDGAKVFAFISAASLALKTMSWMPPWAANTVETLGILATIAHQIFFPNQSGPTAPKA